MDSNFPKLSPRKDLREYLAQNRPLVMLWANRNIPLADYKWSSIALIDIPEGHERVVAPQNNFHAAFSKRNDRTSQENDSYALWSILNHPLAGLWFHECSRGPWITIKKCRNFPLPKDWGVDKVQVLAPMAKELIQIRRKKSRLFMAKTGHNIKYIKTLINDLDNKIYQMYGITKKERHRIEEWFAEGEPIT